MTSTERTELKPKPKKKTCDMEKSIARFFSFDFDIGNHCCHWVLKVFASNRGDYDWIIRCTE